MKRIEKFLLQEDIDPDNVKTNPAIGKVVNFMLFPLYSIFIAVVCFLEYEANVLIIIMVIIIK